ncbi:hypothetical protein C8Q76DRAFT_851494 [Earliella scabrosa]|nr:hypothetical protein C8Q76DRAFT_851494 [Earliella scabrosa]
MPSDQTLTPDTPESSGSWTHTNSGSSYLPVSGVDFMYNLGDNMWEFPPQDIARMLSPKTPKTASDTSSSPDSALNNFDCLVDDPLVEDALQRQPDVELSLTDAGHPANFLNQCVNNCEAAYNWLHGHYQGPFHVAPRVAQRWQHRFVFSKDVRPAAADLEDGVDSAIFREPDEALTSTKKPKRTCWYWSLPAHPIEPAQKVEYTSKANEDSFRFVMHARTCARAQFNAAPLRTFAAVLAVDQTAGELRVLVFHRGGLSSTRPLKLSSPDDRLYIHRLLLSVLLWQTPQDAGFPPFTDGLSVLLPVSDPNGPCIALPVQKVLHYSDHIRGRGTFVCGLRLPTSQTQPTPPTDSTPVDDQPPSDVTLKQYHQHPLKFVSTESVLSQALPDVDSRRLLVIKYSWATDAQRGLEAQVYKTCNGAFGTISHLYSFEACHPDGSPISNAIFLPPQDSLQDHHWPLPSWRQAPSTRDSDRRLCVSVFGEEGQSLEYCESAWDLCECILHCMLGWLSLLHRGYLHRDMSIGNLLKLKTPSQRERFTARDVMKILGHALAHADRAVGPAATTDHASERGSSSHLADFWSCLLDGVRNDEERRAIVQHAKELEDVLAQFDLSTLCKAVISDGDMAADLSTYFTSRHDGGIFGTPEFMSTRLREAMEKGKPYLQSPVDDLQSFWWATLWAAVYNPLCPPTDRTLEDWRGWLGSDDRTKVRDAVRDIGTLEDMEVGLVKAILPLLRKWHGSLDQLWVDLKRAVARVGEAEEAERKRLLFYRFAYRGVTEFVTLLGEQRESIQAISG